MDLKTGTKYLVNGKEYLYVEAGTKILTGKSGKNWLAAATLETGRQFNPEKVKIEEVK